MNVNAPEPDAPEPSAAAPRRDAVTVIYDGACPFCADYTALLRLRQAVGPVRLVDARAGTAEVARLSERFDLDNGMVVRWGDALYHGAAAMTLLATLSAPSPPPAMRALNWLFRGERRGRLAYPVLRACRRLVLLALGRRRIGNIKVREERE